MLEILASVLNRPLERLESDEGPALGAAVSALWGLESWKRKQAGETDEYAIADAVAEMVRFREAAQPRREWVDGYAKGLKQFQDALR
jgi:sugar (pentulose or hexulose) kinase